MNILYSLQHLGYVIPPQADSARPAPVRAISIPARGPENGFTNRNTTSLAWNLMHVERIRATTGVAARR
ncbi:MAG: hypothetical protein ABSG43_04565 [Solirubrobacteraceae bacterium]|jgi:hypothetical protein